MEYKVINILQTRELKVNFTKSEESILDFIEKNFTEIPEYSVIRLCEEAYTSQASVNRICKKLGFKGFSELKYFIEQDIEKMRNSKKTNINNTFFYFDNINFQDVKNVVEILKNNRKILIYGLGASEITALYFQRQLLMHTHWDREWYFTKAETQVLLRNHMFEVIDFLEQHEDIIYILDGQSVMLDDFIEFAPKWKERTKKLVKKGALKVGPWYTQTDLLLVHGESIIRNLYYGIKKAREYGDVMNVGYAPDTFGHSAQMPQIYSQFGIESTFFWRGYSELKGKKSDFIWKGIDGSVIFGVNLATGYQGAKYLEKDKEELKVRMDKIMKVLDNYSAGEARLVMNGHDQMPIQSNIHSIMDNIRDFYKKDKVKVSSFESYVNSLKKLTLETVEGELNHSKHARIHKTITSTRMDIKLLNTELEYKIYNVLEPLAILGKELNIDYPHEIFEKCLKELFGAHAHDSIGGCNSDLVNRDIKQRLTQIKEILDTQIELYMRLISLSAKNKDENVVTLYNYLPYKRRKEKIELELITRTSDFKLLNGEKEIKYLILKQEILDAGLIDRQVAAKLLDIKVFKTKVSFVIDEIEGLSVKYLSFEDGKKTELRVSELSKNMIENSVYKIYIENNKINLLIKNENRVLENVFYIETSGDGGDSYD
ncbi:MAG: hypothetical protein ACRC6K_00770, partial [Fusobacteriaceae bacterium]